MGSTQDAFSLLKCCSMKCSAVFKHIFYDSNEPPWRTVSPALPCLFAVIIESIWSLFIQNLDAGSRSYFFSVRHASAQVRCAFVWGFFLFRVYTITHIMKSSDGLVTSLLPFSIFHTELERGAHRIHTIKRIKIWIVSSFYKPQASLHQPDNYSTF